MEKLKHISLAALALTFAVAFTLAGTIAHQRTATAKVAAASTPVSLTKKADITENKALEKTQKEKTEKKARKQVSKKEILWLARCIYSETKRPEEQELVAWTIRNRMETKYRGNDTYKEVVLDPWQFSAFNRNSPKRSHYMSLTERSKAKGFKTAVEIASKVATAPSKLRPFPETTRHFYSERSMAGGRTPSWARGRRPVRLDRNISPRRFRFYAGVL